ncbi:MAG: hypothetical protein R6U00_08545 [Prochlorococcaceae cyanobacterium]
MNAEIEGVQSPESFQLKKLNALWSEACDRVPYYQELRAQGLPRNFGSLDAFASIVPVFEKKTLQTEGQRSFAPLEKGQFKWYASGGSTTAEPTRFPKNQSEILIQEGSEWYLRSLIGITPKDPYFRIWGHRHLLGRGPERLFRIVERDIKDKCLGMTRFSAYNLSSEKVQQGIRRLQESSSSYVLGFSKALEAFAEELLKSKGSSCLSQYKGVIATAECFSSGESRKRVEEAFGCPVYMEYGSMETGPIAQEVASGEYHVAWNKYLLEALPTAEGTYKLLVTALYPRAFPLFRYDLGDLVSGFDQTLSIKQFKAIDGRSNPIFIAPSGNRIHSVPIIHTLDPTTGSVRLYQIGLRGERIAGIYLMLLPNKQLDISIDELRCRLNKVDEGLGDIPIEFITQPFTTPAGKRPVFVQLKE